MGVALFNTPGLLRPQAGHLVLRILSGTCGEMWEGSSRNRHVPSLRTIGTTIITYSDGEGLGGIGVAIFNAPGMRRPQAGHLILSAAIRDLWRDVERKLQRSSSYEDIYQIEAIGPIVALTTWPDHLHSCAWMHWVDNAAAQSALINGSSIIFSGDLVVGATWELIARRIIYPWFEWVASASNPVDALSRGDARGDWGLVKLRLPSGLKRQCKAFLRDFGSDS